VSAHDGGPPATAARYRPLHHLRTLVENRRARRAPAAIASGPPDGAEEGATKPLQLLSFNIQAGISGTRYRDYLTQSWQHLLPSSRRMGNLDRIAKLISRFDMVGLQEVDAGSLRSGFINQAEYLALRAGFPNWHHQLNRDLGKFAQHSNALLSRYCPSALDAHRLPGLFPGRGVLSATFGTPPDTLVLLIVHLALGRRARRQQLAFIAELARDHPHVIIMGDLNSPLRQWQDVGPLSALDLHSPAQDLHTFPSWRPQRGIDHILVGPTLRVDHVSTLPCSYSDHLPIAMEVRIPTAIELEPRPTATVAV
jgi:endonuclease/exonuclease/phosphatase family metal-dependent hydrolase